MLINLHIKNLALIDELDIDFTEGLNILSGETGAGKSIIIGSIGIGLGGKFSRDLLRDPEKDGLVELTFSLTEEAAKALRSCDVPGLEEGTLVISRRLSGARALNRVNDETVTAARLRQMAPHLLNLHAQHDQRTLLSESRHLEMVDETDETLLQQKKKVHDLYDAWQDITCQLEKLNPDEGERRKRQDFLAYEIQEIDAADLKPGEDDQLEEQYRKMNASRDLVAVAGDAYNMTGTDEASQAGSQISEIARRMREIQKYDSSKEAGDLVQMSEDLDQMLNDLNRGLSSYLESLAFDPEDFSRTEERLNLINSLKMKYGKTIPDILEKRDEFQKEAEELSGYEETKAVLLKQQKEKKEELTSASDRLTELRKKAADVLCGRIRESMKELNFSQVLFDMHFEKTQESRNGHDRAYFVLSTNIGEKMRPLTEVASGGELSRVMLAIKATLSENGESPALVFDEIDTGISGITAEKVGGMMKRLSKTNQILSITHLPQIACYADTHFLIEKTVQNQKTITRIRRLDQEGRVRELARLLGGEHITESVEEAAREMLARHA